jgi:stage V sporulation protein S
MFDVKVSKTTNPKNIAGAIAKNLRTEKQMNATVVGPFALNQLIKGIVIARSYLSMNGHDLVCYPTFTDVEINGETNTAIKMIIKKEN